LNKCWLYLWQGARTVKSRRVYIPQFAIRNPRYALDHVRKALFRPAEIPDAE
jgi:hypothetical protein